MARETIDEIGYTDAAYGFDCETCGVLNAIQSPVAGHRHGRGYGRRGRPGPDVRLSPATRPPELMPLPIMLAHKLVQPAVAKCGAKECSTSCGRTARAQVSVEYVNGKPARHRRGGDFHAAQRQDFHRRRCGPR